jgi:hypothetical protein
MKNEEIDKFNNEENGDAKGDTQNKAVIAAPEPQSPYNEEIAGQARNDITVEELSYIRPEELKIAIENLKVSLKNELPKPRKIKLLRRGEMNLVGIENTKNVALAITKLVNAGVQSYTDDGKITWGDIGHFIKIIPAIISAIPSLKYVKSELSDKITENELNDFKETILNEVELKNEFDNEFIKYIFDLLHILSKLVINRIERGKEIDNE